MLARNMKKKRIIVVLAAPPAWIRVCPQISDAGSLQAGNPWAEKTSLPYRPLPTYLKEPVFCSLRIKILDFRLLCLLMNCSLSLPLGTKAEDCGNLW